MPSRNDLSLSRLEMVDLEMPRMRIHWLPSHSFLVREFRTVWAAAWRCALLL